MASLQDFRNYPFAQARAEQCGKFLGRRSYWKLYTIENVLRVILHSVLSNQIGKDWWGIAVDPDMQRKAAKVRTSYLKRPQHTPAGNHDIYYVFLPDIANIIRANSHLFLPVLPDVHSWLGRIEDVRLPRNLIGHMNFPNQLDRKRIDALHQDIHTLVARVEQYNIAIQIP